MSERAKETAAPAGLIASSSSSSVLREGQRPIMSFIFCYLVSMRQQHRREVLGTRTAASKKSSMVIPFSDSEVRGSAAAQEETTTIIESKEIEEEIQGYSTKMLTTGQSEDPDVFQVDVAFLSYVEHGETNAQVRLDSITFATAADLIAHEEKKRRQKLEMGKNAYKHFKWYIKTLKDELASLGGNRKFKIVHWLINSKNIRAFMIKTEFFPAISIIIAPRKEHWYAADDGRSKYGTRTRSSVEVAPPPRNPETIPSYLRCPVDFCANNCLFCQRSNTCLCNLRKMPSVSTIDEDLEDLV